MALDDIDGLFTEEKLRELFPAERADGFFDALFGDASEGSYDIKLAYKGSRADALLFELHLLERPGKCLACNLTYGLPEVFSRHPVINIKGVVAEVETLLGGKAKCSGWELGNTISQSKSRHIIPLIIKLG
ncbi:MAG: pancreas/duodenum homeobox protein 1 [Proteobacteria bacterium]|nr:pancreas/duodenum homeobox protein 1 [Pseudomonadota bacterium]